MWDLIKHYLSDIASLLDLDVADLHIRIGGYRGDSSKVVTAANAESIMKPGGWVTPWVTYGSGEPTFYRVMHGDSVVHSFWLTPLPGSCATAVETQVKTGATFQRRGVGKRSYAFRRDLSKHYGYSALMGTATTRGNAGEIHIAESAGAHKAPPFVNRRYQGTSGSEINLLLDRLYDDEARL